MKLAVPECGDHVTGHEALEDVLLPADVEIWRTDIEAWEKDNTKPNPFEPKCEGMLSHCIPNENGDSTNTITVLSSEAVRLAMNSAEAVEIEKGNIVMMHEAVSPCVLIMAGIDLEEQQ